VSGAIRATAVAVCRSGTRILLERGYDRVTHEHFYRAIGGGVEFGERAADAVTREWREELGIHLESPEPVGVLENLFHYDGAPRHEIVFVFTADVHGLPAGDGFTATDRGGRTHTVVWVDLDDAEHEGRTIHPAGLVELLKSSR
jgi:ADP-ribose pyrophosphatase YjhB (NUDIX family)